MIPSAIESWYTQRKQYLTSLETRVADIVAPLVKDNGFIFEGRIKSLESLAEKLESGRFRAWAEVDDLYACTIAVPLFGDEDTVASFIETNFVLVEARRRGAASKPPDTFRFDSTRLICRLKAPPESDDDSDPIFEFPFEVQIKSFFELAWAKTTHALTYKSNLVDWRRYRLAAHLKAATEQMDVLLASFEDAAEYIPLGHWPAVEDKAAIQAAFTRFMDHGHIPSELAPKGWSQFADNLYRALQAFEGRRPSGYASRPLRNLAETLTQLGDHFSGTRHEAFPRSLSLFQYTIAVLGGMDGFEGRSDEYYLPITEELEGLFPGVNLPSAKFDLGVERGGSG